MKHKGSKKVKCICQQCGGGFDVWPAKIRQGGGKYCNRKCYELARKKLKVICQQCGEAFGAWPSKIKRGGSKYCGKRCAGLAKRKRVKVKCQYCGKEFGSHPSRNGKYCGKKCYGLAKRDKIKVQCQICGEEFEVYPYRIKQGGGKYCGRRCYKVACSGPNCSLYKDGHSYDRHGKYNSPAWKRLAKLIRKRDNHTCQRCGKKWKRGTRALDVHHRDDDNQNDHPSNLITLCRSCHRVAHN